MYGLENLWDFERHIKSFREDRSRLLQALSHWEAVANSSLGDTAWDFHRPCHEFRVFTDLLRRATKELFGIDAQAMGDFALKCFGLFPAPPASAPCFPVPTEPINFVRGTTIAVTESAEDVLGEYYAGLPDEAPLPPNPDDLARAIDETRAVREAALAPRCPGSALPDEHVNWSEPDTIKGWAAFFGYHRDTVRHHFKHGIIRARKIGSKWVVDRRELSYRQMPNDADSRRSC